MLESSLPRCQWEGAWKDTDEVISFLEESRPDVILFDLYLNGFEGWDLRDRIKDTTIPRVLMLGASEGFVDDARLAAGDGYFVKDMNKEQLKQKIQKT